MTTNTPVPPKHPLFVTLLIAGTIFLGLSWLMYSVYSPNEATQKKTKKEQTVTIRPVPAALIAECSTPCTLTVGWDTKIKTGGRPVLITFSGKKEQLRLSGREDDQITLDQFSPGQAQFVSPDSTPVQVQLFLVK